MTPDYAGSGLQTPPPLPVSLVTGCCGQMYTGGHSRGCRLYVKGVPHSLMVVRDTVAEFAFSFNVTYPTVNTTFGRKESPLPGSTEGF